MNPFPSPQDSAGYRSVNLIVALLATARDTVKSIDAGTEDRLELEEALAVAEICVMRIRCDPRDRSGER